MKVGMYSIRDAKAGVYLAPFASANDQTAERSFQARANDPESLMSQAPEDYSLYKIGEFCDESGVIETSAAPQHVCNVKLRKPAN